MIGSASARFDDLRPTSRRGFSLGPLSSTIVASTSNEVAPALEAAAEAVAAGSWVGGWVSYEAATAFDLAFEVVDPAGSAMEHLPLAWFGVSPTRSPAPVAGSGDYTLVPWEPLTDADHHRQSVDHIRERIAAGDTYQVNHTFRLESSFDGDPTVLYAQLVRAQSCGYGALIDTGEWAIVSASPELFFEWRNGVITCRPMKGTARRGVDVTEDEVMRSWLQASEKNRAENVMIVDMVRNDLGRIARTGTVRTPALFTTEKYDTVWQLTSTVTARPPADTSLLDVFGALFPSASITGAPKISTMSIIADLEQQPRGVYCGAIGFGGPGPEGPEWAFNVGIRTVAIERSTGRATYGTGGGITYDSEPSDEYAEAVLKAAVLGRPAGELRLLETTRWDADDGFRHLDRHLDRVRSSAAYFDIPFDAAEARAALAQAVRGRSDPARIRMVVDRSGWIEVQLAELVETGNSISLAIDDRPVDRLDPFLHHKTTVRRVYEEAARRHPDADDVILCNDGGEVTETTVGSLAVLLDDRWFTPPLTSGLLAGTERSHWIESGKLSERVMTRADLDRASAFARLNSVRGWAPAHRL